MAQFIEFIGNHLILAAAWLLVAAGIVFYHQRTGSKSVSPQGAVALINRSDGIVIDLRDKKDFDAGHIVDSINIPYAKLAQRLTELDKHKETPVIVVCKLGQQSGMASKQIQEAGFLDVHKLAGGISEWRAQSLPVVNK
ncbi:MAG: rhodanese-related sulfurtransferase [Glaciecola sp.]|jgi:rhodanese-related sulfurtransferase